MTGVSESSFSFVSYNHPPPPVNVRAVRILPECILVLLLDYKTCTMQKENSFSPFLGRLRVFDRTMPAAIFFLQYH